MSKKLFFENGRLKNTEEDIDTTDLKKKLEDVKKWAGEITRCLNRLENKKYAGEKKISV